MEKVPVLIFANKQDLETALSPDEIITLMELEGLTNRFWMINACSALKGEGVTEGMQWLVDQISKKSV